MPEVRPVTRPSRPRNPYAPLAVRPAGPTGPDAKLQAALDQALKRNGLAGAGVMLVDLGSGRWAGARAEQAFGSASLIKLPVMIEVFRLAQLGRLDLGATVTIQARNKTGTWQPPDDPRPALRVGDRVKVRDLVDLMITRSDNVATNTLADLLDRGALNATMARLGCKTTTFARKIGAGTIPADPGYTGGRNLTSAADMARLLTGIANGTIVDAGASRAMLGILGRQHDHDKIPAGLPTGARVYHKTGETSGLTHDVAIVEASGRRYVLCILTERPPGGTTWGRMADLTADLHFALGR